MSERTVAVASIFSRIGHVLERLKRPPNAEEEASSVIRHMNEYYKHLRRDYIKRINRLPSNTSVYLAAYKIEYLDELVNATTYVSDTAKKFLVAVYEEQSEIYKSSFERTGQEKYREFFMLNIRAANSISRQLQINN